MPVIPLKTFFLAGAAVATAALFVAPEQALAAPSQACDGGGFVITELADGTTVGQGDSSIAASRLGSTFLVKGKYIEFHVVSDSFGIRNYLFTGAPNPEDLTGGRRTPVWAEKTPDHRGLVLTSAITVDNDGPDLVIKRSGTGDLDMKIQAKDCAQGGIFQMEPERGDHTATLFTHVLDEEQFYFDNPRFRAREGELVPYKDILIPVPSRINIANNISRKMVTRDSSQSADRRDEPSCPNVIPRIRLGGTETVLHCGGVSRWDVESGGRMGFVTGQDAVEVAPPTPDCTRRCRNRSRVRGQSVVLGFPFPVPNAVILKPREPSDF